jgi:hypothetical protein
MERVESNKKIHKVIAGRLSERRLSDSMPGDLSKKKGRKDEMTKADEPLLPERKKHAITATTVFAVHHVSVGS